MIPAIIKTIKGLTLQTSADLYVNYRIIFASLNLGNQVQAFLFAENLKEVSPSL